MIPGERYVAGWLRPLRPDQLRQRLQAQVATR
jgi:hypothetical protein